MKAIILDGSHKNDLTGQRVRAALTVELESRGWEIEHVQESITPVWEANHVWLVFDLVIFWTAFPRAFAAVMTAAALPLWLAVAGIVLRGAGFAFRKELSRLPLQRAAGATFAFSSLLTRSSWAP